MNVRTRNMRPDLELVAGGAWAKTGKKTYRHVSGHVVRYDHMAWAWEIVGGAKDGYKYRTLTYAAYEVERALQP